MARENSMNNSKMMSALILAVALAAGTAHAADLPYRKATPVYAPIMPPAFSWTGFYAGASVGGGFSGADAFNSYLGTSGGKADGVVGGIQVGYNYQVSPMFVVGIENDFMASGLKTRHDGGNEVSLPFYGTGRARAGVALMDSRLLVYGTGGMAFGQVKDAGVDKMRLGWTAGGGVEWAFQQNWSAKLEYLYTDLSRDFKKDDGLPVREQKFQTVTVGLNYHF
ncbi:porin family protein [Bradyrhizobium prioriisuperbiae]|uniref:outer membrane protein n=1 Tax=Bradyrhizobium prioriisuperbiae TaxID=2854389 RepID=UPI0028E9F707|nr:porin family protein [Bradyrhizobium prioritasuperba]